MTRPAPTHPLDPAALAAATLRGVAQWLVPDLAPFLTIDLLRCSRWTAGLAARIDAARGG